MLVAQQTILIVDDKVANLRALEEALSGLGAKVVKAETGNEALAATLHHDFALCVLDIQMPGMSGYELAEILRRDQKTQFLPIIFLTAALLDQSQVRRGYEAGAVEYVTKPFEPFILESKVKFFLQLDQQRKQLEALLREREDKERLIRQQAQVIEIGQVEKMTALGRLTASVAHELNQPLNAMRIICEGIQLDRKKQRLDLAELDESMVDVGAQIARMAKIVDHLRLYSRKIGEVERVPLRAGDPLDGALALVQHKMTLDDISLSVELDGELRILGDQLKLEQVFVNLLSNACDAVKTNERPKRVELSTQACTRDGVEYVVFAVADNGCGIPEDARHEIFEPFFTRKAPGEGTGLGLSIVKEIVEGHGGTIAVQSTEGSGTTFEVALPRYR